jgi:hypothetical protein
MSANLDGSGLYNDPQSVLGPPARRFYDQLHQRQRAVSIVAPPVYRESPEGEKLATTLPSGQFIKVRFDEPVEDHPRNPFGIDLILFGNSFFVGQGFVLPDTDMAEYVLYPALFGEQIIVAVSPTGLGDPRTRPDQWYTYSQGPFSDGLYPTNAYNWDGERRDWGEELDFTLPVNPTLTFADFGGLTAAEAIEAYECSGGGTGYDLSESGFPSIQYVYLTGTGGEVDALADVFPALGDFDRDGDVDLRDYVDFQNCFAEQVGPTETCACRGADWDGSGQVTLADHADGCLFLSDPKP